MIQEIITYCIYFKLPWFYEFAELLQSNCVRLIKMLLWIEIVYSGIFLLHSNYGRGFRMKWAHERGWKSNNLTPTNQSIIKAAFSNQSLFLWMIAGVDQWIRKVDKYRGFHSNFVVWLFLSWTETFSSFANKSIAMDGEIEANCRYISYSYFVIISIDVTLFYFKYLPIFMLLLMKHFYCIQWH